MIRRLLACVLLLVAAYSVQAADVVWLVRHAEQTDPDAPDPELTPAGLQMAERLGTMLQDAGIVAVWSTDTRRTRQTATPLARSLGLEIGLYDPRDLESFAGLLREAPGPCLVVGHSNTTPRLVELLGGDPHGGIGHREYDRLYLLESAEGGVRSIVLRIP